MFSTRAKLLNRARERLVAMAKRVDLVLRQCYSWNGKYGVIRHKRHAHAKQFKRANKAFRNLRNNLGRTTHRDDPSLHVMRPTPVAPCSTVDLHLPVKTIRHICHRRLPLMNQDETLSLLQ